MPWLTGRLHLKDKRALRRALRLAGEFLVIGVGALLVALAADLFLIPNKVVSGGVTDIATILHYQDDRPGARRRSVPHHESLAREIVDIGTRKCYDKNKCATMGFL